MASVLLITGCGGQTRKTPKAWQEGFREQVKDATSLAVVIRGRCEGCLAEPISFRINDPVAIRDFIKLIEIEHYDGRFIGMCSGNDTITFLHGEETLVQLVRIPFSLLSWRDERWKGDAVLTDQSYQRIAEWFSAQGFPYFMEEMAANEEAEKRRAAADAAFVASFPEIVRPLLLEGSNTNGEIDAELIVSRMDSSRAAFVAVSRSLGREEGHNASWSGTYPLTRAVLAVAHASNAAEFWDAVDDLSDDPSGQFGAGRLFFFEKIGRDDDAAKHLDAIIDLARTTLVHGYDQNKPTVMRYLSRFQHAKVVDFLRQLANGDVGTEIDRKNLWDDEPGIRAHALLSLALQNEKISDKDWHRWSTEFQSPPDQAAIEIAGCLWGKGPAIQSSYFRFKSSTLGLAAIEALVRTPGPMSLGMLATAGLEHPWASVNDVVELAIEQMIGEKWERKDRRRKIEEWLGAHPSQWIKPTGINGQ